MAKSSVLRETIDKVSNEVKELEENKKEVPFNIEKEIIVRFIWYYYGINFDEYLNMTKTKYHTKAIRDFFQHIQEKIRKDTELI